MQAQKKMDMKNLLEQEKMELHHQIKRRIALETIVSALEVRAIKWLWQTHMHGEGWVGMLLYLVVHWCLVVCYICTYNVRTLYVLQEEEHKATVAAKIQVENQRMLEDEHNRQTALLKAGQMTAKQQKERNRDALLLSPCTSHKPIASPTETSQTATGSVVAVQLGHAVPSQKSIASVKAFADTKCSLPGQVQTDEDDEVTDYDAGSEGSGVDGTRLLTADKETNTSMSLLNSLAHLIPATNQAEDCSMVAEGLQESTTSVQPELSRKISTASQTGLSMADITAFTEELENEGEGLDAKESQEVDEKDYLEAVAEVQAAISRELLESAIRMSPQISEALVERVASLGPEAMEVLEEIRSKFSVRSQLGSELQSIEASTLSVGVGRRTPTPYPSVSSLSTAQTKSSTSSISPSGKVVSTLQFVSSSLQSINEGTASQQNESACVLESSQEDNYEESAERCCEAPPTSESISIAGSSTNPQCLSLLSTCVAKDTAKALIDQIFCEVMQNPMFQNMPNGDNQEATGETDASVTGEFKCLDRQSISVPSSAHNLQIDPGAPDDTLQTTVSEMPLHESGSSSTAFFPQTNSSRPPSSLKDCSSTASVKRRSPAASTSMTTAQANTKAKSASVQSTKSIKDRLLSQGSVSVVNGGSRSRPASKASIVSQKASSRGGMNMSQRSFTASRLNVAASHKSVNSQQSSPVSVKKLEIAMPASSPIMQASSIKMIEYRPATVESSLTLPSTPQPSDQATLLHSQADLSGTLSLQSASLLFQSSKRSSASLSAGESVPQVPCDHPSKTSFCKTVAESMEQVLPEKSEAPPTDAEAVKETDLGCESVTVPESAGADIEEADQSIASEDRLRDADNSMNSMASSGSLPRDVFVEEASAEVLERAPSRHADSATSGGQSALQPPLSPNAEAIDQSEAVSTRDAIGGLPMAEEGPLGAIDDGEVLVQEEKVQTPDYGAMEVSHLESVVVRDGREAGECEEQIGDPQVITVSSSNDGETPAPTLSSSSSVAGQGILQPPNESFTPAVEGSMPGVVASQQTSSESTTDGRAEENINVLRSEPASSNEEVATKAMSEEEPVVQGPSTVTTDMEFNASAASVAKASYKPSMACVGMESSISAVSVGKPSSEQPSPASVSVSLNASAVSIGKPASKQPSAASVSVRSKTSTASIGKPSSEQPSPASVNVSPNASAVSVRKPSSKQPSAASVSVRSKTSTASIGKPSSEQPSPASVNVSPNASAVSVRKPSSKQPSAASVSVRSKSSTSSVGKSSSERPSSKQPSRASIGMGSKVSVASLERPSSKQPSVAGIDSDKTASVSLSNVALSPASMDSNEQSSTGEDEVISETVAQARPTNDSDADTGSLHSKGAPPGSDEGEAATTPASQLVCEMEDGENTIVTEPAQSQTSSPCVQANAVSLNEDSVETVHSEMKTAKQMSGHSVKQGDALSTNGAPKGINASNSNTGNDASTPVVPDNSKDEEVLTPPNETVSDSVPPAEGHQGLVTSN